MQDNILSNTFSLQVDNTNTPFLTEAAKWGKFLSILGFVCNSVFVLFGLLFIFGLSSFSNSDIDTGFEGLNINPGAGFVLIGIYFIVIALLWFFPCYYLYHFSSKMQAAIKTSDQESLNKSFSSLKSVFKFFGILAIIAISLWALSIVFGLLFGLAFSG